MTIMVRPIFASLRIIRLTFRIFVPSSPLVGSSSTIIGASCISATPRASRCFCPPDSVEGCCLTNGISSRASRISSAAFFRSGLTSAPVVSSSSRSSPKSWLSKSWGMYQTFPKRPFGLQCFPNKTTSPDFSFNSPARIRPMVLLPVPLGPIRATTSPLRH